MTPGTVVGRRCDTGEAVKAGLYGHVASMYFNPMHDSLLIMIVAVRWYDIATLADPFGFQQF